MIIMRLSSSLLPLLSPDSRLLNAEFVMNENIVSKIRFVTLT